MTIKPMLANKFQSADKLSGGSWCVQPKLDGVRCLAYLDNGALKLQSRSGKPLLCPEGLESGIRRIASLDWGFLDGELMLPEGYTFEQTVSAVRNGSDRELSKLLEYHIYDGRFADWNEAEFYFRWHELRADLVRYPSPRLVLVHTSFDMVAHNELHADFIRQGYEGTMYRDLKATYKHGRSSALLKRKDFLDQEFTIIGHKVAADQHEGCVVWEVDLGNGRTCEVTPAWTLERRRAVATVAESYYGKLLTVRYQEWTADGSLRFPVGVEIRDYE